MRGPGKHIGRLIGPRRRLGAPKAHPCSTTTSILLNIPGEAASVVTCMDGHQMAKTGRAGAALGVAAIGSFVAGTLGVVGLSAVAPPLAGFALRFGPPECFSLTVVGLLLGASASTRCRARSGSPSASRTS